MRKIWKQVKMTKVEICDYRNTRKRFKLACWLLPLYMMFRLYPKY